jgi:hypothetical protein
MSKAKARLIGVLTRVKSLFTAFFKTKAKTIKPIKISTAADEKLITKGTAMMDQ